MFYFSKMLPLISCAIVIGLCWHRDTNSEAVTFIFKKNIGMLALNFS